MFEYYCPMLKAEGNISQTVGKQFPIVTDNDSLYWFCCTPWCIYYSDCLKAIKYHHPASDLNSFSSLSLYEPSCLSVWVRYCWHIIPSYALSVSFCIERAQVLNFLATSTACAHWRTVRPTARHIAHSTYTHIKCVTVTPMYESLIRLIVIELNVKHSRHCA